MHQWSITNDFTRYTVEGSRTSDMIILCYQAPSINSMSTDYVKEGNHKNTINTKPSPVCCSSFASVSYVTEARKIKLILLLLLMNSTDRKTLMTNQLIPLILLGQERKWKCTPPKRQSPLAKASVIALGAISLFTSVTLECCLVLLCRSILCSLRCFVGFKLVV